ncbi:hypothetical protein MJO29_008443 [Puccinia striiformis f. sp. tritici]|nr:hypothetical protein MJO29_008443 [Puccinia striiformis f. sp. tritici]
MLAGRTLSTVVLVALSTLARHSSSAAIAASNAFTDSFTKLSGSNAAGLTVPDTARNAGANELLDNVTEKKFKVVRPKSFDSSRLADDRDTPPPPKAVNAPTSPPLQLVGGAHRIFVHQPKNSLQPKRFQDSNAAEDANQFFIPSQPTDSSLPQRKRQLLDPLRTRSSRAGSY